MSKAKVLAEGLYFGEGPRWHEGRLWFSDFYDRAVRSADPSGNLRTELELDDQPSGLGWLPDGRLLVVAMKSMKVLRQDPDGLHEHADLTGLSRHLCNDMVVDRHGRAWVGNFGFDLDAAMREVGAEGLLQDHPTTNLVRVDPDGAVHLASKDMHFPNGSVITPNGKTLIVAESLGLCLTAFDIDEVGNLSNRRIWAPTGMRAPDGICLDENGNVWVANALANECLLFGPGGEVLQVVETSQPCFACMLGGDDGRTLFMLTAVSSDHGLAGAERTGKIETTAVSTGHAGYP
mgnify:FL=1